MNFSASYHDAGAACVPPPSGSIQHPASSIQHSALSKVRRAMHGGGLRPCSAACAQRCFLDHTKRDGRWPARVTVVEPELTARSRLGPCVRGRDEAGRDKLWPVTASRETGVRSQRSMYGRLLFLDLASVRFAARCSMPPVVHRGPWATVTRPVHRKVPPGAKGAPRCSERRGDLPGQRDLWAALAISRGVDALTGMRH